MGEYIEDSETSEELTPELEFIFDSPETAKKIFTSFMALKWPDSEYPKLLTTLLTEGVYSRSRTCSLTDSLVSPRSARAAPLPTSKQIVDLPRRRRERRRSGQWFPKCPLRRRRDATLSTVTRPLTPIST